MSLAALSFAATLPTYTNVGSNGTTFANDKLSASGNVLFNTSDPTTGRPSVLASGLTANGLSYNFNSYAISGDTLTIIYGQASTANTAQTNEASDITNALSDNLPGNQTNFATTGGITAGNTTVGEFSATTQGVADITPTTTGSASSIVNGTDGTSLALQSISTGAGNTLDVVYQINPGSTALPPTNSVTTAGAGQSSAVQGNASQTSSTVGLLAGGVLSSNINSALGPTTIAGLIGQNTASSSPASLLAGLLSPSSGAAVSIYNIVTSFSNSSANVISLSA